MLKAAEIFLGLDIYFPLNLMAWFWFALVPPFSCLIKFKSLVGLLDSVTFSSHFSLLWVLISAAISWFKVFITGEVGLFSLSRFLSFIFSAVWVGTSGNTSLILPLGIVDLEVLFTIFLNAFSPLYTSVGWFSLRN